MKTHIVFVYEHKTFKYDKYMHVDDAITPHHSVHERTVNLTQYVYIVEQTQRFFFCFWMQ